MSEPVGAGRPMAIAVVGLSGRFPGAASLAELWANLREGRETITFFSDDALIAAGEDPAALASSAYVKAAGRLDDIAGFDASFFGLSPRDASICDPQHRLFLECAWEAFEHAGYLGERVTGPVGVFASSGAAEYLMHNLLRNRHIMASVGAWLVRHTGNDPNFLATRVSYALGLTGPSMSVQTACSSSLAAVHLACQSLLNGECDMALAGGATVYPEQDRGYWYKEGEILSPDGHCRAFDARSAGTVMASAVGCAVLKRLDDAERDGDQVLAIIRGSAINNDGSDKVGYLAPSVAGQTRVVSEALAVAGVHPEDVSYVEAHGTGTLLGDPIEITALTTAFRAATRQTQFCAIGSMKTNVGHAGEAAGICGLIKTVLALQHRQIPASLHFETPNPQADFPQSPFFVNTSLRDWSVAPGKTRIAGVTALGAGGTNVHMLVEEAPTLAPGDPAAPRGHQLLVLSARSPAALDRATDNLREHLRTHPEGELADTAFTLLAGRKLFPYRRAVVATSAEDARAALDKNDPKRVFSHANRAAQLATYFMFPGGGAQYPGMGADLYERETVYRTRFDEALEGVEPPRREMVRALVLTPRHMDHSERDRLESPSLALPALFATEYALAQLLLSWGLEPAAMIGHSAGEYAAACIAGVLSTRDAMTLVGERGRLFERLAAGAMLSVQSVASDVESLLPASVSYAAVNAPGLCVLSGPATAIAEVELTLRAREIDCTRVHIGVAAHSAMVEPILAQFERVCRTVSFGRPRIPFVSNVTGTWITDAEAVNPDYWVRHLRSTVRFADGARTLLAHGAGAFCEVGPGRTLSSLVRQQEQKPQAVTATMRHPDEAGSDVASVLSALGRLWVAGVDLDQRRIFARERRRRVALPTYPFERQRYWVDPDESAPEATDTLRKQPDIGDWFYAPSWARSAPPPQDAPSTGTVWLVLSDESAVADELLKKLRRAGHRVVDVVVGQRFQALGPHRYALNPSSRADFEALVAELRTHEALPQAVAHLWALTSRGRSGGVGLFRKWNALDTYTEGLAKHYFSLIWLAQALAGLLPALRLYCVSSRLQYVPGDVDVHPEKATLLGPCKVIPLEYPQVSCVGIDVSWPNPHDQAANLADQLLRELVSSRMDGEVALRGTDRWVRRFDSVRLEPVSERRWIHAGGAYLITGGLGHRGLHVAEHLARQAPVKLALLDRQTVPASDALCDRWIAEHGTEDETTRRILAVRSLRALGAEVLTLEADVTDQGSMRGALTRLRSRFGSLRGVVHAAATSGDEVIAQRRPTPTSPVMDTKVKGALILDILLAHEPLDFFVLFSSVDSILGLPGRVESGAANAFLDAFAHARARRGKGRTVAIDWHDWLRTDNPAERHTVDVDSVSTASMETRHPALETIVTDEERATVVQAAMSQRCWIVGEHVVRGGDAPFPGTGFLEFARAALEVRRETRAVEFRDVLFVTPLTVAAGATVTLHVRVERQGRRAFSCYGTDPEVPYAVGTVGYTDAPDAAGVDLAAIRARCPTAGETDRGQLVQHFMNLGPRWGSVHRVDLGTREALVELALGEPFIADLDVYHLHPALLDLATLGAHGLVPRADETPTIYVPFSYGRVLLRRALTARIFSHVRLRQTTKDAIAFDAILYDEHGEELAVIDNLVRRRAAPEFGTASAVPLEALSTGHPGQGQAATEALRLGLLPPEALEALDRILAVEFSPQVVACTVPLDRWRARLRADAMTAPGATAGAAGEGPVFARPSVSTNFVPPSDAIEHDLAAMWCGLLGLQQVGVHDDFFELGGQSLVAVRLFQRIGKQYGVELPLAALFEAPTIAACATLIRQELGTAASDDTPEPTGSAGLLVSVPSKRPPLRALVTVQEGHGRTPFFCVHGAGGNVLNLRDLARAMDRSQPVYGLQASGVDGVGQPRETIEEMADAYLAEILARQPRGPYLFGGYSGGGLVAFEMARRLTEAGERMALLALIDTMHPQMHVPSISLSTRLGRLRHEGAASYLRGVLERRRQTDREAQHEQAIAACVARGETIPYDLRETYVMRRFDQAMATYTPKRWTGKAALFRATDVDYFYRFGGPVYGWERDITGGIEIVSIPGNHHTMMVGTNALALAQALWRAIERAHAPARGEVVTTPGEPTASPELRVAAR